MVSNETLSKYTIGPTPTNPGPTLSDSKGSSEDTYHTPIGIVPLPLPRSKAPSVPANPLNIPGSRFFERYVARLPTNATDATDAIIAVMGPTGAGKSSFVNMVAGREEVVIGDHLRSQTNNVQLVRCPHPDGRRDIVLADTPGFDNTHLSDIQVLKIIANWLMEMYQGNVKLSGLLYFHRISDVRFSGTPLRNLSVFRDLCGENNLKNVILITTMWDELEDESVGFKREEDLLMNFWNDMICFGSQTCRFQGTHASAWDIVGHLDLGRLPLVPLQIQEEMVNHGLKIQHTTAAKTLHCQEVQSFWGRILVHIRIRDTGSLQHQTFLSRSPTSMTTLPESTFHSSSTVISDFLSDQSGFMSSPAECTSTGCCVPIHCLMLGPTIMGLRLAHQVVDIPILQGAIGTALHIAQLIEAMGGTHHAISDLIQESGWLLKEITQYAMQHTLHKDMIKLLKAFSKELKNVQEIVMKISSRASILHFFLHDADVQAVTACTMSIKAIYAKIEVRTYINNQQAVAYFEDQLKELHEDLKLRQCRCGISVVDEESRENEEYSALVAAPVNS